MTKYLSVLTACLVSTILVAQMPKIDFVEYDLDNGLHVILHEDKSTPIVAVTISYHVGSKNENPDRTGFAHFFEHLMFEGSKNIERGEFDTYTNEAGGMNNANTNQDRTFYFELLPSNQLELGLWLESERLLHAKVENVGIETQREVVKEERRLRVDNSPYGTFMEEAFKRAFTKHPYNWSIIGSMAHLEAAQEEDYVNFYKDFYVPNNAILSIAGDLDIEQTKIWIDKYFGSIPKGTKEVFRPNVVEPPLGGEVRDTIYDNIQLPGVFQSYRIPGIKSEDYHALNMMASILSEGQSSRMYKSLVDEQQLAVQVVNFPLILEDAGLCISLGISNMGVNPNDMENAMDVELDKIKSELISVKEFEKLRNQIESNLVSSYRSVQGIAEALSDSYFYHKDTDRINNELDAYLKVTREDIKRVANKYMTKENRVVLYYLPKSSQPKS